MTHDVSRRQFLAWAAVTASAATAAPVKAASEGPMKGVPYDGNDPQYQDLYHKPRAEGDTGWLTTDSGDQREWFNCVKELVDLYHPDLLYFPV